MATEIKTWHIVDDKLIPISSSLPTAGRKEKDHLEQWIKTNPSILGADIAIIGEQVQTASGPMDFLGVDSSGNIIIIELKRDKLPREALAQAIDYASDVASWELDRFREICQTYSDQSFEDYFQQHFENISLEDLAINQTQRLMLVGFAIEDSLSRMIEWLSDKYNLGVNAIVLNYVKTPIKAAQDESQAGYFLSLISLQLGHKWKDYLRQVISYEFPNHPWEKDNFKIPEGYVELVKKVLKNLDKDQ